MLSGMVVTARRHRHERWRAMSSSSCRPVRGMRDLFDDDVAELRGIEETARRTSRSFGFKEVSTPILEHTDVFVRTVGEMSDIVGKEMYTFQDKSGDSLSLRPENTAGVVRALVHEKLGNLRSHPEKLMYCGPMFRRERPQRGRLRQFHQIGVEYCGSRHPFADVEVIALAAEFLRRLELGPEHIELQINSLGDESSQSRLRDELNLYFSAHRSELSKSSVARLDKGAVLRILDSKESADREIIANVPMSDVLSSDAASRFRTVRHGLDEMGLTYTLNPRLVRGLDYYTHTTFEFVVKSTHREVENNGQAVLAGGRYDGLARLLGSSRDVASVGWAMGVERAQLLRRALNVSARLDAKPHATILIAPVNSVPSNDAVQRSALNISQRLRQCDESWTVQYLPEHRKMANVLKEADRVDADWLVVVGGREIQSGSDVVSLRNMRTGERAPLVSVDSAVDSIRAFDVDAGA